MRIKTIIFSAFILVCVFLNNAIGAEYNSITKEEVAKADRITVDELKETMSSGKKVVILDLRSPGAYKSSGLKIKGDIRTQPEDLKPDNAKLPQNKDILIVTYCT